MQHSSKSMALSATLHCLTGCSIGEILGLIIGTVAGLTNAATIAVSILLAFVFGYTLSMIPLLGHKLPLKQALTIVLAADTLSIIAMEITDNTVVAAIPGAMDAQLVDPLFWISLTISLIGAFIVAFPVNKYLLEHGKGHALVHEYH